MSDAAFVEPRAARRPPTVRRVVLLVVGSLAVVAAASLVMHLMGFDGWDAPAHLYKIAALHRGSLLWDNEWYGGAYQLVSYGFVFYWLAQFINYTVLVVASAAVLPILFYVYMRRVYEVTDILPSAALAGVLAVYLANGQDPFLLALALTVGGLVADAHGRHLPAAVLIGVACFADPVAVAVGVIFLAAQYLARPEHRPGLRRLALYLVPFFVARLVLTLFFWQTATYNYTGYEVLLYASFGAGGVALALVSDDPQRRAKATLFGTFGVVALAAAFLPANPMGGTFGRFFFVFGAPLFLTVRRVLMPRVAVIGIVVGVAIGQLVMPAGHFVSPAEGASTKPAFFAGALAFAAAHYDPDYRYHVVALSNHWEAYYFPLDGYAITRGWYRQSDALHNELLNQPTFSANEYVDWLRDMGVEYVFLPHAPLDTSGPRETAILTTDPRFTAVYRSADWTVYRLQGAQPIVVAQDGLGVAHVTAFDRESIALSVSRPGSYLVKVSYSPYWRVASGEGTLTPGPDDFMVLNAPAAGALDLRIVVTPQVLWNELVTRLG
jgi:hypothetical protein